MEGGNSRVEERTQDQKVCRKRQDDHYENEKRSFRNRKIAKCLVPVRDVITSCIFTLRTLLIAALDSLHPLAQYILPNLACTGLG